MNWINDIIQIDKNASDIWNLVLNSKFPENQELYNFGGSNEIL